MPSGRIYKYLKRILDIIFSYTLLIIFCIPMVVISVTIRLCDGHSAIFKQIRIGKNEKKFVCYKFRTMRTDAPSNLSTNEFSDAYQYVTRTGAFLRRTSLDELPQLFNVLVGDMSFIGPRPLIPKEKEIHKMRKNAGVYNVRPGITGLAQICGRDRLSDQRKAECDAIYSNNINFITDLIIIKKTISNVMSKDGIK